VLALLAAVPLLCLADAVLLEPRWIIVREHRLGPAPGCRIVHISDLHHRGGPAYLTRAMGLVNDLEPDLVCCTGDLAEDPEELPEVLEILQLCEAPVYGVSGNHDRRHRSQHRAIVAAFQATGGDWLDQAPPVELPRHGLALLGWEARAAPISPGLRRVLLLHEPEWVEHAGAGRFDLMLAGHSHGGQIRLPGIGPLALPDGVGEYVWGWYDTRAGPLHVSTGLGTYLLPARFCCRPEITLINF
jgi:predicted MPP superfamily phosphohydrolase